MTEFIVILSIGNILFSQRTRKQLGKSAEGARSLGAATTRVVIASDPQLAFELAKDSAERELRSSFLDPILNDPSSPLNFEIVNVREKSTEDNPPRSGFTFFIEPPVN